MRRSVIVVTLLVVAAGSAVAQQADRPEQKHAIRLWAGEPYHPLRVKVYVFVGKPAALEKVGLSTGEDPWRELSAKAFAAVLKRLPKGARVDAMQFVRGVPQAPRDLMLLHNPKMTFIPGQRAYTAVSAQSNYVRDVRPAEDGAKLLPVIAIYQEGIVLDLRPDAAGDDQVVYRHLRPTWSTLLGLRTCTATVELNGKKEKVIWQEPVMLMARPRFESPCDIRIGAGDALVVPLDYVVEQGAAGVRALVVDGKVQEVYEGAAPKRADDPGRYLIVCVLTAEVLAPVIPERNVGVPQFPGPTFELQPGRFAPPPAPMPKPTVRGSAPTDHPK